MDELRDRLKTDAEQIRAHTSTELQRRLDASLAAARSVSTVARDEQKVPWHTLWWVRALTGLGAAAVVILLVNRPSVEGPRPNDVHVVDQIPLHESTLPEDWDTRGQFPWQVESADLTRSLEQELIDLQSDLEKARKNVEQDVQFTF